MSDFKLSRDSKFIILTAVLASLLEIIDTSIVNVAIPTMMGNLGATLEDISWVVTGYIIANAIVLPISAWLGSRIGRRKYYVGCILAFTLASVLCGLAPNLFSLTLFRIIQGLAGGALLPTSQTLIQEQFPKEKAGLGSAIYGMSVMVGPTLGPTLGGFLTDHYGWRSIFNINLPLGLIAAFLALAYVSSPAHEQHPQEQGEVISKASEKKKVPMDSVGLTLLCLGIGCLQYILERGQADEWFDSMAIRLCTVVALVCIPSFIVWELRVSHPIINLRLFKDSVVRNGTLLMSCVGTMLFGMVFMLPVFVSRVMHFDATQTGELFIPGALLTAFCMPFVGQLLRRVNPKYLIFFGVVVVEVCLYMMTLFTTRSGYWDLFWALLVRGLGMAFLFVPINTMVLGKYRGENLGQAAGLLNLSRQLGGSLGIALIATLVERMSHQNYSDLMTHVHFFRPYVYSSFQGLESGLMMHAQDQIGFTTHHSAALKMMSLRVDLQAFMLSFRQVISLLFFLFAFSIIPLFLLKVDERKPTGGTSLDLH